MKGSYFVCFFLHSTEISLFPFIGLEYSAGEGTKFDSSPGKLFCFHPVLFEGWCSMVLNHSLVGVWRTATEEWGTEDWNEDVSISGYIYMRE